MACVPLDPLCSSHLDTHGTIRCCSLQWHCCVPQDLISLLWGFAALKELQQRHSADTGPGPAQQQQQQQPGPASASSSLEPDFIDAVSKELFAALDTPSPSEPPHPQDLTDVAVALSQLGLRSAAVARLMEAVAHEVYRQLSNRHSMNGRWAADVLCAHAWLVNDRCVAAKQGGGMQNVLHGSKARLGCMGCDVAPPACAYLCAGQCWH
jgi:hypothetical protein